MMIPTPSPLDLLAQFEAARARALAQRATFGKTARRAALKALSQVIMRHRANIIAAVGADQGKAATEVELVEIMPTLSELSHARSHLGRWMAQRRVWPTLLMLGTSARVMPQPKGVVLVIGPWNFPVLLALGPVISALAAGNRVILKPSEVTPATSALLARMMAEAFPDGMVQVVQGGPEVAQALTELPFDHIFFTGSPAVGKIVMQAAARNLTPVTLELGGKSPVVIGPDADMAGAARWLAWGKGLNAGQICVAPDHVFVPRGRVQDFAAAFGTEMARLYGADPAGQGDLSQIVNARHFDRLNHLLADATTKGARVQSLGADAPDRHLMTPKLIFDTTADMALSQDEIFGPLLPILPYDSLDQPIAAINAGSLIDSALASIAFDPNPAALS